MKHARLPCGCQHSVGDREVWTEMCPTHGQEERELHERAQREHKARREAEMEAFFEKFGTD